MLRVGLTGGIGCGKSTVAAMMAELGCHVLNADKMAHALIAPGEPAYNDVVRKFGTHILAPDGSVDRARLAALVFADGDKLASLNAIVHPRVLRELDRELERQARLDPHGVAVVEAALLIESGYHRNLDRIILVTCTHEQQLERLTNPALGRGMSREQAEQRIAAQMPVEEKRKQAADKLYEIDCSCSLDSTRRQIQKLVEQLKQTAGRTLGNDHHTRDY
jgi:dephospho-CoA kinase